MEVHNETMERFDEINVLLDETDIPDVTVDFNLVTVKGAIIAYKCDKKAIANYNPPEYTATKDRRLMLERLRAFRAALPNVEAFAQGSSEEAVPSPRFMFHIPPHPRNRILDSVWRWKDCIREFVAHPKEGTSPEKIQWLDDGPRQDKICLMITALEELNTDRKTFQEEPYLFFERITMDELENVFVETMDYEVLKKWKEYRDDHNGLWETLRTIVGEVIPDSEMYIYNPGEIISADPLKELWSAASSCYCFLYKDNTHDSLLLCMQFSLIFRYDMFKIRQLRGDEGISEEEGDVDAE